MQETQKLRKRYDHVIIGYNLSSLTFAFELFKKEQSFCVLDAKHLNGSGAKFVSSVDHIVSNRIPFNNPLDTESLPLSPFGGVETREGTPITFDKGDFKSFLGFGDTKIQAVDAVSSFCTTTNSLPQLSPEDYWKQALEAVESQVFLDQQITNIEFDEEGITQVSLNGKTTLIGSRFYFFDQFPFVFEKLGQEIKKQASQFAKAKWYSSVNVVMHHEKEPENYEVDQLYLLMGSKNQPCLGQFSRVNGHLISRWETFIPAELTPDSETTGAAYKEIKKQFKRAFPNTEISRGREHILLHDRVYANLEKTGIQNGKVSYFNNLFVFSPLFENSVGWAHEIACGLKAAEAVDLAPRLGVAAPATPC